MPTSHFFQQMFFVCEASTKSKKTGSKAGSVKSKGSKASSIKNTIAQKTHVEKTSEIMQFHHLFRFVLPYFSILNFKKNKGKKASVNGSKKASVKGEGAVGS